MRPRPLLVVLLASALGACPTSQDPDVCVGDACGCDDSTGQCMDLPATCAPDSAVGEMAFCTRTTPDGYLVVARYDGPAEVDLSESQVRVNGADVAAADYRYDAASRSFTLRASGLAPSKYSVLLRLRDTTGRPVRPLFVPMWIGPGALFAEFTWHDSILYQIFTDRFLDGNPANNIDNAAGDLARVTDPRSQWQGGDFAGITQKIREGYFEALGVNTLWISSPVLNSHSSQPAVSLSDPQRYASYHAYHPIATGFTHLDDLGYPSAIEPAFGTEAELHELVNEAHRHGIRIIPDFVVNHVQSEAALYQQHPEWFFSYTPCDGQWDSHRLDCWFTSDMPDFDFGGNPEAVTKVVDHALWLVQEFNFDGFRADALKHLDDVFTRALKAAVVEEIETTVKNHDLTIEPTVFYMVGESLGGWARYHVRPDMVQGQVDEEYYQKAKAALLTFGTSVRDLADFSVWNDTAYLTPQDTFGGRGGYPGAIMGNFFGNHDQVRALTEAFNSGGGYERLRLAQTFLMTSPGNIPMLYQGDDIGTTGGPDPDNRKMHRFTNLTLEEQRSLANVQKAGTLRAEHPALRRGRRSHVVVEDWFWVYKLSYADDEVFVAINRDNTKQWSPPAGYVDGLGNCSGGSVPVLTACIFVRE